MSADHALVERLARARVLVLGDVMLDRYVYGTVDRMSPEAPIPVVRLERVIAMTGGAANVARNIAASGHGQCWLAWWATMLPAVNCQPCSPTNPGSPAG